MEERNIIIVEEDEICVKKSDMVITNQNIETNNEIKSKIQVSKKGSKQSVSKIKEIENDKPKINEEKEPNIDPEEIKKFNEKKKKIEENLIKYSVK